MRQIEIVFTKSKVKMPIFSWAIMLWTGKPYSHVARKLKTPWAKKSSYFQANEGKVNYEYEDWFLKEHKIIKSYTINVPDAVHDAMGKRSWQLAGQNYGLLQNIGIVLVDIAKIFNVKIKNPWKKGVNCSELMYRTIFQPMFPDLEYDPETIKPHEIEDIILDKFKS